jgi:hypothetical protein
MESQFFGAAQGATSKGKGVLMRLVLINHLHPDTGMVGSVRFWRFSQELALLGHQVILLCASAGEADDLNQFSQRLHSHDWSGPLLVAAGADPRTQQRGAATQGGYRTLRRLHTAWDLVVRGGPFWEWGRDSQPFLSIILTQFKPQLCYATFGNLDALNMARSLAHACKVPWVMDIKDPANAFLPKWLRPWLIRRYRDAAAVTLNADFQRHHNKGWSKPDAQVVYSGVEPCDLAGAAVECSCFALVGAIYDDAALLQLLKAFKQYIQVSDALARMVYYGKEGERVRIAAQLAGVADSVVCAGMVERYEMLRRCGTAAAVCYIGYAGGFHHKLLELAALGRPLIVCPKESAESHALMAKYNYPFFASADQASLFAAMNRAGQTQSVNNRQLLDDLGWPAVTKQLEQIFMTTITNQRSVST